VLTSANSIWPEIKQISVDWFVLSIRLGDDWLLNSDVQPAKCQLESAAPACTLHPEP